MLSQLSKVGLLLLAVITLSRSGCKSEPLPTPPSTPTPPRGPRPKSVSDLHFNFQASQQVAHDLTAAKNLQNEYQNLKNNTTVKPGSNQDSSFVKIDGMKIALRHSNEGGNLDKFKEWAQAGKWNEFHLSHYDWWMFPINRESDTQGHKYSVYQNEIQQLKADQEWLKDYRLGVVLLMASWGWDIVNKQMYSSLSPDQKWQNSLAARLGKAGNSLILFEQWDLYAGMKAYVKYLRNDDPTAIKEEWVMDYFK